MRNRGRAGPCLEISCETFFQPRIPAHLIWCILDTACTLFLGTHLKYNPPPYLRKLTTPRHQNILSQSIWRCLDHVKCRFNSSLHRSSVLIFLWCPFVFHLHISTTFKQTLQGSQRSTFWHHLSACLPAASHPSHPFAKAGISRFAFFDLVGIHRFRMIQPDTTWHVVEFGRRSFGSLDIPTPDALRLRNIESLDLGWSAMFPWCQLQCVPVCHFGVEIWTANTLSSTFLCMPASGAWKRWLWLPRVRL